MTVDLPFGTREFFTVFERYNSAIWPMQVALLGVALAILGFAIRPARVRSHAAMLNDMPTAFLSVCLAVLEQNAKTRREVANILERFFARTGWRPPIAKPIAGAVRYTRYGWLKRLMMKRIVGNAGGGTDTTRDYEYTDWNDLRAFAGEFARQVTTTEAIAGGVR